MLQSLGLSMNTGWELGWEMTGWELDRGEAKGEKSGGKAPGGGRRRGGGGLDPSCMCKYQMVILYLRGRTFGSTFGWSKGRVQAQSPCSTEDIT